MVYELIYHNLQINYGKRTGELKVKRELKIFFDKMALESKFPSFVTKI